MLIIVGTFSGNFMGMQVGDCEDEHRFIWSSVCMLFKKLGGVCNCGSSRIRGIRHFRQSVELIKWYYYGLKVGLE